jgi:hypothetical protein
LAAGDSIASFVPLRIVLSSSNNRAGVLTLFYGKTGSPHKTNNKYSNIYYTIKARQSRKMLRVFQQNYTKDNLGDLPPWFISLNGHVR